MKIGKLVQIRNSEHLGLFVVKEKRWNAWVGVFSLKTGKMHFELERCLVEVNERG